METNLFLICISIFNKKINLSLRTKKIMSESRQENEKSVDDKVQRQIDAIQMKLDEFSLVQADHFASVRNDIDIRRETLIDAYERGVKSSVITSKKDLKELQKKSDEMMKQLELAEEDFRNNFIKNLKPHLELNTKTDEILREKFTKFFQLLVYDLCRNKFKPSNTELKSLGKLKVYKPYYVNVDELTRDEIQNVIICSNDKFKIEILNMNIGCKIRHFLGHTNDIECLIRYGEDKLISASRDETIRVWNLVNGECEKTLRGHTNSVKCLKLLKNGQLASGSVDSLIKIWSLKYLKINHF